MLPNTSHCRNQYSSLLQNHQKLRTEYQKLLSVTSELTAGLENVAQTRQEPGQGQVDWKNVKYSRIELLYLNMFVDVADFEQMCPAVS